MARATPKEVTAAKLDMIRAAKLAGHSHEAIAAALKSTASTIGTYVHRYNLQEEK